MSKQKAPVKLNEQYTVVFEDLTQEGAAVAKIDSYTLFVPEALPGERAIVQVTKVNKSYGYGRLVKILEKSADRIEPICPVFFQCGGCKLQHMRYERQLWQKEKIVRDALERIGKITNARVHPVIGMPSPWRYRNKAQVPVAERNGKLIAGFYEERSHNIIDMDECFIQHEANDRAFQAVKKFAAELAIPAYDEVKHRGVLRHIVVRYGHKTNEVMVVLVTNGEQLPRKKQLIQKITSAFPNVKSIVQNINSERTNVIFGSKTKVLWGEEFIYDYIGDVKFAISARSFYQVNPEQTEVLYNKALEYANLTGNETVIDAYCGIGTISLFLAKKAKHVYGVEIVPDAIRDAERNAGLNGIKNVTFAVGAAEEVIPKWQAEGIRADVIVVDPPRKGCDTQLLECIIQMKPKRIVYVSCNPSTLARDLRILEDGGFKTEEVQPVDMFPMTMHVECVVLMSRVNK